MTSFDYVTRVELIDGSGRVYVNMSVVEVLLSLQDEERTLKIFIEDIKDEDKTSNNI